MLEAVVIAVVSGGGTPQPGFTFAQLLGVAVAVGTFLSGMAAWATHRLGKRAQERAVQTDHAIARTAVLGNVEAINNAGSVMIANLVGDLDRVRTQVRDLTQRTEQLEDQVRTLEHAEAEWRAWARRIVVWARELPDHLSATMPEPPWSPDARR